ncbi:MAG: LutB/LldF family L-lactate oxidation iron-sulfur protein [Vicinamibacterales bacterium]
MNTVPLPFHRRIEQALADRQLRVALDRTTSRFTGLREAGLASLVDADATRDRARAIRARTIARLGDHLERFEASVIRAGGSVHWARDADHAVRLVLEIAAAYDVRRVVKSKSMVSEEVELNAALEAAGLSVVESDLGEYIIQLAGEPPSHIIAPAIHKTKEQVGALFHEALGVPLTDSPEEMTAVARRVLRREFLGADMGISGVNFGVAETGTLAVVTNEGNASLGMTTARVHVALMGIERLVPTLDDLAVMLQVLARSATGQKLSVYTDLVTGPRRRQPASDADGPSALHVVLVDNGRSGLVTREFEELLYCIRCGACLNACPVYREIGGHAYGSVYPGPIGAVLTPALRGASGWSELAEASSLCGACRDVCPVRIDIPRLLLAHRTDAWRERVSDRWPRVAIGLLRAAATRPRLYRALAGAVRIVSRFGARDGWRRRAPWPLSRWTSARDLPALAPRPFREEWRRMREGAR